MVGGVFVLLAASANVVAVVEDLIYCRSDQNRSDRRRWAYLIAYNTKRNDPVAGYHLPQYSPINMVGNNTLLSYLYPSGLGANYMH